MRARKWRNPDAPEPIQIRIPGCPSRCDCPLCKVPKPPRPSRIPQAGDDSAEYVTWLLDQTELHLTRRQLEKLFSADDAELDFWGICQ